MSQALELDPNVQVCCQQCGKMCERGWMCSRCGSCPGCCDCISARR